MTHSAERFGYWTIEWSTAWDPSLTDVVQFAPELVLGNRVAITSCDSGPYEPSVGELSGGWSVAGKVAISKRIAHTTELPAPGFDEWYVFNVAPKVVPTRSYVNRYNFSVFDDDDTAGAFWEQVRLTQPLHVLGAGTPNMFFATRDRASFEHVRGLNLPAQSWRD